jgi:hypothetical protein
MQRDWIMVEHVTRRLSFVSDLTACMGLSKTKTLFLIITVCPSEALNVRFAQLGYRKGLARKILRQGTKNQDEKKNDARSRVNFSALRQISNLTKPMTRKIKHLWGNMTKLAQH